jgi:hypothetical protein
MIYQKLTIHSSIDYIMAHHQLKMDQIKYRIEDSGDEFLAIIQPASLNKRFLSSDTLGHVYFNDSVGMVEITISYAKFSRRALETGLSTKTDGFDAAGRFGMQGELGQLHVCQTGHQIEIVASGFKWRYKFGNAAAKDEDGFYCCISKVLATDANHLSKFKRTVQAPSARPERDASIKIGNVYTGRANLTGKKLTRAAFDLIKKEVLVFNSPTELLGPPYGAILMDRQFCGSIYAKGFLAISGTRQAEPGYQGKKSKWGYNFLGGTLAREEAMRLNDRVAQRRALLIDAVIHQWKDESPQVLQDYTDMLRNSESKYSDADGAERFAPVRTARSVWGVLESKALEQNLFYHNQNGNEV